MLLDEPFSKLDADLNDEVCHFLFKHVRDGVLPTVRVSHEEADVAAAGGAVVRVSLP